VSVIPGLNVFHADAAACLVRDGAAERVPDYFEQDVASPFMMHVVGIKPERRSELSAVTHEDDTGRLQTVARDQDPLYYDLIAAVARRTGTPVLLNTSFNETNPSPTRLSRP